MKTIRMSDRSLRVSFDDGNLDFFYHIGVDGLVSCSLQSSGYPKNVKLGLEYLFARVDLGIRELIKARVKGEI